MGLNTSHVGNITTVTLCVVHFLRIRPQKYTTYGLFTSLSQNRPGLYHTCGQYVKYIIARLEIGLYRRSSS